VRWTDAYTPTPDGLRLYIESALQRQAEGTALPFAVVSKAAGKAIGSTRYGNIDPENRRVEIGWTWYGRDFQRTAVNTECKYLLLRHAFETLGCLRVEFKTDVLNERSRKAILRIGAKEEGVFRKHMVMPSGRVRDTVYFSIVDTEWPAVKMRLGRMLARS
jgi:RimJ/RimL family protein N-acetyltransferase